MFEVLSSASFFAVHPLSRDQEDIAAHFAQPGLTESEQFLNYPAIVSGYGNPILADSTNIMECRIVNRLEAGDHDVIIGQVKELIVNDTTEPPLIFHDSSYTTICDR